MKQPIIAVDGPAGAGKSTVARRVAQILGFHYIDTGAMYRALAYKALQAGIDLRDAQALDQLLRASDIAVRHCSDGQMRVSLDGEDVTAKLRNPEVNASVSLVAGFPPIRDAMVRRQRELASAGGVVMDGRDIGTYVLPEAQFKFFLTASLEARARRRQLELSASGFAVALDALAHEIRQRDILDSKRPLAPLYQADDAILIDTTDLPVDAVVEQLLRVVRGRRD